MSLLSLLDHPICADPVLCTNHQTNHCISHTQHPFVPTSAPLLQQDYKEAARLAGESRSLAAAAEAAAAAAASAVAQLSTVEAVEQQQRQQLVQLRSEQEVRVHLPHPSSTQLEWMMSCMLVAFPRFILIMRTCGMPTHAHTYIQHTHARTRACTAPNCIVLPCTARMRCGRPQSLHGACCRQKQMRLAASSRLSTALKTQQVQKH